MQEVRDSIPGRSTTDFCTLIQFVYIISCIVLFSYINPVMTIIVDRHFKQQIKQTKEHSYNIDVYIKAKENINKKLFLKLNYFILLCIINV